MKTNELRIGNLLQVNWQPMKVTGLDELNIQLNNYYPISPINPIILDETWLIKMKFHRWGESNTFGNGKVIIHKRKRGWVINTKTPVMESVHQFMNYHYAVTGIELTVS